MKTKIESMGDEDRYLIHCLNESIQNVLDKANVKLKNTDSLGLNPILENDYIELLEKFKEHLILIEKTNKESNK